MAKKKIDYGTDEDFINNYNILKSSRKMAERYNCDKASILNHAKEIGYDVNINAPTKKLSKNQEQEIVDKYYTHKAKDLAKQYNCSKSLIIKIWANAGITEKKPYRVYELNENFFQCIDTPEKAYFLGLLSADGNISTFENKQNTIRISLQQEDRYIIEKFEECISTNKPIRDYESDRGSFIGKYSTLELSSDKISNDLGKYNLFPNHTHSFKFFIFEEPLMSHYVRGYFDGDGCITFRKKDDYRSAVCSICGYHKNLVVLQNYLSSINITTHWREDKRDYGIDAFGNILTQNKKECYDFIKYLYGNCNEESGLFLKRKKEKADLFLSTYNKK